MDEQNRGGSRWWLYLTPVYLVLALLLGRWIVKLNSPDLDLNGAESAFSGDGELAKRPAQAAYDPGLDDGTLSVRYQSGKQAATAKERQQREREQFAAELARKAAEAKAGPAPGPVKASSQREKDFLARHDPALKRYQEYMNELGMKYWKKYPIIRQIDAEFSKMDRFMALKAQYEKDRDAYKWARGTLALPEVRSAILKYATSPSAMLAGIDFASEALKNPPPKPIYNEMMNFVTKEPAAMALVNDVSMKAVNNVDEVLPQAMAAGIDVSSLQNLGGQITAATRNAQ